MANPLHGSDFGPVEEMRKTMKTAARTRSWISVLGLLATVVVPVSAEPSNAPWPQWRGPHRDATVPGDDWPGSLAGLQEAWRVELGPSYSGPIVAADRVFVTETHDEREEIVRALDRSTGRELWRVTWDGAMKVPFFAARSGSWIRATPAFDGERLYVGGMREVLVALDAASGEERWRIDFPERFGTKMGDFGFVCSPLLDGEHLYVEAAQSVFKLVAATGEVVWRSETFPGGMMSSGSFSSPVLAELAGRRQLLVQTREALKGIDPETGKIWWSHDVPSFRGMNILTPSVHGDGVFTSTFRNASYFFRVEADDDGTPQAREIWQNTAKAYMSSPVVIGDHVYVHQGNGRLTSIDLESGATTWTTEPFGDYWSMVVQGSRVLALASDGNLLLFDAAPDAFHLLDRVDLETDSETWAHLAVAGDRLYVRALDALIVYQWRADGDP